MIASASQPPGVIRADECYTQAEFCRRAGMARKSYHAARRACLMVVEFGKKRFVRGVDWLTFLAQQIEKQKTA